MARNSIHVAAPPEQVFAVLADGRSYAEWVVGAATIEDVDSAWPRRGAALRSLVTVGPLRVPAVTRVLLSHAPRRLVLDTTLPPLLLHTREDLRVAPEGDGSRVTLVQDPVGHLAPLRLVPAVHMGTKLRNREALTRLRRLVENRPLP